MTDQWWGICSSCWNPDPLLPSMQHIVEKITEIVRFFMHASLRIINLSEQSASSSSDPTQDVCGSIE